MSWSLDSSEANGADDDCDISLFDVVVRIIRLLMCGRRSESCEARADIGVKAATGSASVGGRLKPGNEVRKTFIVRSAILFEVIFKYRSTESFGSALRKIERKVMSGR